MKYVFYDLETTGKNKDWSQIIQFGAVCVDEQFNELDRFETRCRLKTGLVPEPEALIVNNTSIKNLENTNLSHYDLTKDIKRKIENWSPAIFFGYNSINFDEEIIRKTFFKTLFNAYVTQLEGNKRGDILNVIRSFHNYDNTYLKTIINSKGNSSFKLEDLAKENQINHKAHDAMGDVLATIDLAKIVKKNDYDIWKQILLTCSKKDVDNFINLNKNFSLNEFSFGKIKTFLVTSICNHPNYNYPQCYDLSIDPEPILSLSYQDLKKRMKEKPKFLKTLGHNKHPSIFNNNYFFEINNISKTEKDLFENRSSKIRSNKEFIERIKLILDEEYHDKENIKPQNDILAEESLYFGGFPSNKDKNLMEEFHLSSWKDKYIISERFEDKRYEYFAKKIIYEEAPENLPTEVFNKFHKQIGEQIMTLDDVPWFTIPKAYKQIDDLRNKYSIEKNNEMLNFVEEINIYIQKMEKVYSATKFL